MFLNIWENSLALKILVMYLLTYQLVWIDFNKKYNINTILIS